MSRITVFFREVNPPVLHYLDGAGAGYTVEENCIIVFDNSGSTIYPIDRIAKIEQENTK